MKSTSLYIKILFITFLTTFFGMDDETVWGKGEEGQETIKKAWQKTKPINCYATPLEPNPLLPLSELGNSSTSFISPLM